MKPGFPVAFPINQASEQSVSDVLGMSSAILKLSSDAGGAQPQALHLYPVVHVNVNVTGLVDLGYGPGFLPIVFFQK